MAAIAGEVIAQVGTNRTVVGIDGQEGTDLERVAAALVTGFRDYCTRVGLPRVVLGLSGGIDSALVAAIAADALGPQNVRGVMLPRQARGLDPMWAEGDR